VGLPALEREIESILHSRKRYHQARVIYENPDMFDRVKRAWAVWMLANSSYGCKPDGGFGYSRTGKTSGAMSNKQSGFTTGYAIRLQQIQIVCHDALRIIRSRDTPETVFYLDPPYVGADQGHYDGYTRMDFDVLFTAFEGASGEVPVEFLPQCKPSGVTRKNGWYTVEFRLASPMTHGGGRIVRDRVEALTANYPISTGEEA
jgi:DNA adenine methylase